MSQIITNYTTYDLAYYYADLARLPRLSDEKCQQLITSTIQTTHLDPEARKRLIEGHLKLATHVAIDRCPASYYRSLPDILGEVALTLVNVACRSDFQMVKDIPAYVVACTDGAVKRAIGDDRLIKVPSSTLSRAKKKGTEKHLYELQPESLDKWMEWYDTDEVEEPPASPLLPTHEASPRDPVLRAQVQAWLSYLSPSAQQVLTLRYGLSDEDERCLTPAEIARELGFTRRAVQYIERDAKQRIQALVEGTATIVEKDGKRQVRGIHMFNPPSLTPEQEALFMQIATRLCEQGIKVSSRILAKEAGKSIHLALAFLRVHRDKLPSVASAKHTDTRQERLAHVAHVYADLVANGKRVSIKCLARAAHVRNDLAAEFMHMRKEEHDAA